MSGSPFVPRISADHLAQIYAHARREFPSECCGYILGEGDQAQLVVCANRQDKLHALDPEAHPRTSANAYNIGGRELLNLVRSFEGDTPARIIYHSHPRVGAYFSEEDTRAAAMAGYPVDYLVIDCQESQIKEALLFRRGEDTVDGAPVYVKVAHFDGAEI